MNESATQTVPTVGISAGSDLPLGRDSPAASLWKESLSHDPRWLEVLRRGLRHRPYWLEAKLGDQVTGVLPLAHVESALFGGFLVSLPYLNTAGVLAKDADARRLLIDRAVELADELDVKYLELRHEESIAHPALQFERTSKVHMRLALPSDSGALWDSFRPKVRNQIRKGEQHELSVAWGGLDLLGEFYDVFSRNMRDLGTPVYGVSLFRAILEQFPAEAELCVVRCDRRAVATALLVHGPGATQVPSASSLRSHNKLNANMLMYWNLLRRAVERGQPTFDFGRSSQESSTYRFKKQWGAAPEPACWQYYVRRGNVDAMRPESASNQRRIRIWRRLPVWLTRRIGPFIVRGIP